MSIFFVVRYSNKIVCIQFTGKHTTYNFFYSLFDAEKSNKVDSMPRDMISMFCQWASWAEYRKCHTAKNTRVKTFITLSIIYLLRLLRLSFCFAYLVMKVICGVFAFHIAIILLLVLLLFPWFKYRRHTRKWRGEVKQKNQLHRHRTNKRHLLFLSI